jgi:hypothetical protein
MLGKLQSHTGIAATGLAARSVCLGAAERVWEKVASGNQSGAHAPTALVPRARTGAPSQQAMVGRRRWKAAAAAEQRFLPRTGRGLRQGAFNRED